MIEAISELKAITLFQEDLSAAKKFYTEVFGLDVIFEDADSTVVKLGNLMVNLLKVSEAPELVEPRPVAEAKTGTRTLLTVYVPNADAVAEELRQHGVKLLHGPADQPWGLRTAAFADPAGHVWEIAEDLADKA